MAGIVVSQINATHQGQPGTWPWWLCGSLALIVISALTLLPLGSMIIEAGTINWASALSDTYTQRVIRFSLYQALLSTLLSLGCALPVALALAHTQQFPGRNIIVTLFSLSLVIPTIVAIYGIVAVYGRTGWLSQVRELVGLEPLAFYGLTGILIAHVFFNMPLAARIMLISLESIPQSNWRLARQLGMGPMSAWKFIEWPTLRGQLPGLALLVFTLCFTSFAIVMTLGGGPRATTIEVAIYQSLRFDFDIPMAVTLACIQFSICLLLTLLSTLFKADTTIGFKSVSGWVKNSVGSSSKLNIYASLWSKPVHRLVNTLLIAVASLFVLAPLMALAISGVNARTLAVITDPTTLNAIVNTGVAAVCAAVVAVTLSLGLLVSARHLRIRLKLTRSGQWLQLAGNMILIIPPVVLGTGLFLLLRPFADVFSVALLLVILINSLMALPFVLRIMDEPMMRAAGQHEKLIRSLGVQGLSRWRYIDWPQLRKPLAMAFAFAATLSAGDLSAIALFGSEQVTTLPLLLYQRMGSYRLDEAAVTAGLLLLLCLLLFMLLQRLIGGNEHAAP
ncbi:MAG: thiamine/thiamine pyrophosphate ABC transporter permease [Granulosicoccus sp.]